jgi:hypothetical protein
MVLLQVVGTIGFRFFARNTTLFTRGTLLAPELGSFRSFSSAYDDILYEEAVDISGNRESMQFVWEIHSDHMQIVSL